MTSPERGVAALARACGAIVAVVGALIVLGWAIDEVIIPSGVAGAAAVKANTGLCLLLAGVALVLPRAGRAKRMSQLLGAAVGLVGALTLIEYSAGVDLGIDELLFSDPSAMKPGRMAPNTAACFALLGSALLLRERPPGHPQIAEPLALVAVVIGWLALLGAAADLNQLAQVKDFVRIAPPTAACVVLLGTAGAIAPPGGRFASLVAGHGPAGAIVRRLLGAVLVVPLLIAGVLRPLHDAGTLDDGAVILLLVASITVTLLSIALFFAVSLERATEARAVEEERGKAILASARDAIVTADSSGQIVAFNAAAERMFGLTAEEAQGASLTVLMPDRFRTAHEAGMRRFLAGGESRVVGRTAELVGRRADAEEFPLELSLSAFEQRGETLFTGILRDVSERVRNEAQRGAQHDAARIFADAQSTREAMTHLVRALGERLGWSFSAYWAVDPARTRIRCEALWRDPALAGPAFERATRQAAFAEGEGLPGQVWAAGEVVWIPDLIDDPNARRAAAAEESGVHAGSGFPLRRGGEIVGVVEFFGPSVQERDDRLLETLASIGRQVGQFLERKEAEDEVRRSAAGLRQSQHMARLGSWDWDVTTNEVTWSEELYRLYGIAPEELEPSYEGFLERVHPDDREAMKAAVAEAYETGNPFDLDHRIVRSDGSVRVLTAHGEVTRDAQGNTVKMAGTGLDVTERRAAERELERRTRELERSNAELEQFAYVASHDLQEPLRSIGGFVQLLQRRYGGQLDDEADRFIGFTVAGVERMQALIDDLLTYSRVGRGELHRSQVDSRALAQRTLTLLDAALRDAGAEVELGELPTIVADEAALGQVFQNLLANALKFTDGQPPRLELSASHTAEGWSFAVADNGIGIEPDHAERIFRIFQRLHAREQYGGTGVGLAICKRVIERHGGRIWCEPRSGGGTVFRFTIPDRAQAAG